MTAVLSVLFFLSLQGLYAASVMVGDLIITVDSVGSTADLNGDLLTDERNLTNNKGIVGSAVSSMSPPTLVTNSPVLGNFSVTANSGSAMVERTLSPGSPVSGSSLTEFEITFSLAAGEEGTLNLDFDYELQNLGISSSLVWSLTGPDANVSTFGGSFDTASGPASQVGSISSSDTLSTSGTYTFTIIAEVPLTSLSNIASGEALFSNFALGFQTIPEPSTPLLLSLVSLALLSKRRR